jgi:glycerate-2-kinase
VGRPAGPALIPRRDLEHAHLRQIAAAAIAAVEPERLVSAYLASHPELVPARVPWALVSAGKAAPGMTDAVLRIAGPPPCGGIVAAPGPCPVNWPGVRTIAAGHPLPDAGSAAAGEAALALAAGLDAASRLVVLLSGGASAMLCAPVHGVTLDGKIRTTDLLLRHGADIAGLNAVRKHLSRVKGGRLAASTPAACLTLALSDVVAPREDDPAVIGSGPTVGDETSYAGAWSVIDRAGVAAAIPAAVRAHLLSGAAGGAEDTPPPGSPALARSAWHLVGSRRDAMRGASREAERLGYDTDIVAAPVVGEARAAALALLDEALARAARRRRPCAVIASGETTVTVRGRGRGGRNQELTLALALAIAERGMPAAVMSVGTDGVDGPTAAAGAIADEGSVARAAGGPGGDARARLHDNDSGTFFAGLGDLVATGPTGTNVADLQVLLLGLSAAPSP